MSFGAGLTCLKLQQLGKAGEDGAHDVCQALC
jgi:hypothetical protein